MSFTATGTTSSSLDEVGNSISITVLTPAPVTPTGVLLISSGAGPLNTETLPPSLFFRRCRRLARTPPARALPARSPTRVQRSTSPCPQTHRLDRSSIANRNNSNPPPPHPDPADLRPAACAGHLPPAAHAAGAPPPSRAGPQRLSPRHYSWRVYPGHVNALQSADRSIRPEPADCSLSSYPGKELRLSLDISTEQPLN